MRSRDPVITGKGDKLLDMIVCVVPNAWFIAAPGFCTGREGTN
jgi:hypothetical protein